MQINKPENQPYMIVELLTNSKEEKCIYLIEGNINIPIKIGRNSE